MIAKALILFSFFPAMALATTFTHCPAPQNIKYVQIPHSVNAVYEATVDGIGFSAYMANIGAVNSTHFKSVTITPKTDPKDKMLECTYQFSGGESFNLLAGDMNSQLYQNVSFLNYPVPGAKQCAGGDTQSCDLTLVKG